MKRFPVVAAFLQRDGKVFLAKRPEGKLRGGFWEFPGGKLEKGEAPQVALKRELFEELGIKVKVGNLLAKVKYDYPDVAIELLCYACEIIEGEPKPLEGQGLGWFGPAEIEKLRLAPADERLWRKIRQSIPLQS